MVTMNLGLPVVGYIVLGFLFFTIIISVSREAIKNFGHSEILAYLISVSIATFGFWFPFIPVLRNIYLGFLVFVATAGIFLSRMFIVISRFSSRVTVYGVILFLVSFDVGHWIFSEQAQRFHQGGIALAIAVVSWGIFVFGMYELNKEFAGPIIEGMKLPHSNLVIFAFFLASIVFVPLEFLKIHVVMVIAAIAGILGGFILQTRFFKRE